MKNKKIAVIGCGNLGQSIINGILDQGIIPKQNIIATRRNKSKIKHLQERGINITDDNVLAVRSSDVIIVALKPYNIRQVLEELKNEINENQILVSLATGISLEQLQDCIGKNMPIFRAMPNTAADVSMSMTCISTNTTNQEAIETIQLYFNSFGKSIMIDDTLMDAATVLGACGIAYALRFIRGMIQGGIQIGFDATTATEIATQTVKGASELLMKNGQHPEFEIDKVTTPKGCTIEGLNEMEHNGFSSALIKGIVKSYEKI